MGAAPRFGFTTPPQMATLPTGLVSFEKPNQDYDRLMAKPPTYQNDAQMWTRSGSLEDHPARPVEKMTKEQRHLAYQRARLRGKSRRAAAQLAGYHCCSDASYEAKGSALDKLLGIVRPSDLKKKVVRP